MDREKSAKRWLAYRVWREKGTHEHATNRRVDDVFALPRRDVFWSVHVSRLRLHERRVTFVSGVRIVRAPSQFVVILLGHRESRTRHTVESRSFHPHPPAVSSPPRSLIALLSLFAITPPPLPPLPPPHHFPASRRPRTLRRACFRG